MTEAYVDTSAVLSVAFNESGWERVASRLSGFSHLVSSNLLEAEVRSAFARNRWSFDPAIITNIGWVYAERSLSNEFEKVLEAGYLRGADLWHLATALHISDEPSDIAFLTLDRRQGEVAAALGFHI